MATIGSKKVTTVVIPANFTEDGKELVIEFQNGLAKVPKKVKRFLLDRSPDIYFDPMKADANSEKFSDDYQALLFYISKIKMSGSAPKLCSMLKSEYESLQGELMSGKYNVPAKVPEVAKVPEKEGQKPVDDEEDLVTGDVGDKINGDENKKKKKKLEEQE